MKLLKNQRGMVWLEIILIIVVLASAGFAGYGYYAAQQASKQKSQKSSQSASSNQAATVEDTATIAVQLAAFLNAYNHEFLVTGNQSMIAQLKTVNLTADFINTSAAGNAEGVGGADAVMCTQGGSDQMVRVDTVTVSGSTGTAVARQYYSGTSSDNVWDLSIRKVSGQWKVYKIVCHI